MFLYYTVIEFFNTRSRLIILIKAGFPLANIFARSDFLLNLISSTWFRPKAQGQREKVASRENIR